jgi:hypothetical protein
MATTRIYLVTTAAGTARLVKAAVPSQAITHVAKQIFSARIASQDDLVEALSSGIKVETYGESTQSELDI